MKANIRNKLAGLGIAIDRLADTREVADLLFRLHPVSSSSPLVRIGGDCDGGYLVPDDLDGVVGCFSPGVDVVASFETAIAARGIPCYLADASVSGPPVSNPLFKFDKKFVGVVNDGLFTTMDAWVVGYVEEEGDLLLQMDIEGSEWPVFLNMSDHLLRRFRVMVVEFHNLDQMMTRTSFPIFKAVFDRILEHFIVVHSHPNNIAEPLVVGSIAIPRLIEMTFLRRDRCVVSGYATTFPHPLDQRNVPSKPDLVLPRAWFRSSPQ